MKGTLTINGKIHENVHLRTMGQAACFMRRPDEEESEDVLLIVNAGFTIQENGEIEIAGFRSLEREKRSPQESPVPGERYEYVEARLSTAKRS